MSRMDEPRPIEGIRTPPQDNFDKVIDFASIALTRGIEVSLRVAEAFTYINDKLTYRKQLERPGNVVPESKLNDLRRFREARGKK